MEPLPCRICEGDGDGDGDGDMNNGAPCPRCDGEGTEGAIECPACDGEGETANGDCLACDGEGRRYPDGTPYTGGEAAAAAFRSRRRERSGEGPAGVHP